MKRFITDRDGKQIEVTDIDAGIAQVKTYTTLVTLITKILKLTGKMF